MKKVSFTEGNFYDEKDLDILPDDQIAGAFIFNRERSGMYRCIISFTAEITVKIVPYES